MDSSTVATEMKRPQPMTTLESSPARGAEQMVFREMLSRSSRASPMKSDSRFLMVLPAFGENGTAMP